MPILDEYRAVPERMCEVLRWMYANGWASGTGGGVSVQTDSTKYFAPSGVAKEEVQPSDIFVFDKKTGEALSTHSGMDAVTACRPIFDLIYKRRGPCVVLHSHSKWAVIASVLFGRYFTCQGFEMLKGLDMTNCARLQIPIIHNTGREENLPQFVEPILMEAPSAFLVRRHGLYVWGRDIDQAKKRAECLHWLFEVVCDLTRMGFDVSEDYTSG